MALWDLQDIATELSIGVCGWGRVKKILDPAPAINAVVLPDKLFEIAVSEDHRVNAKGLAKAVRWMPAEKGPVQLFFVVPPDVFSSYQKQNLTQDRGDLASEVWHVQSSNLC